MRRAPRLFSFRNSIRTALRSMALIGGTSCVLSGTPSLSFAADPTFERVQLSNEFYSEGGTHGDYNGDGKGDVAVGPFIYWGPDFEKKSRYYEGPANRPNRLLRELFNVFG